MGVRAVIVGVLVTAAVGGAGLSITSGGGGGFTCTTTISSGSVSSALSSMTAGGTLCLNAGSSYTYSSGSISKASTTTVRAASGLTRDDVVLPHVNMQHSHNVTFQTLTINGADIGDAGAGTSATNVTMTDIAFTDGICIHLSDNNTSRGILVSYSSFINIAAGCGEGRIGINGHRDSGPVTHTGSYDQGVVIDHNLIQGPGVSRTNCSDGIQGVDGAVGYTVTNNEFKFIDQNGTGHGTSSFDCDNGTPGVPADDNHIDPFQPFDSDYVTVTGNYFNRNTTGYEAFDGVTQHSKVENNVWYGNGEYGDQASISCGASDSTFLHNTVDGVGGANVRTSSGNASHPCDYYHGTFQNNIVTGGLNGAAPDGTVSFNMSATASLRGTSGVNSSSPVYSGGAPPLSAWASYDLASSSPGYHVGSSGSSMGINP